MTPQRRPLQNDKSLFVFVQLKGLSLAKREALLPILVIARHTCKEAVLKVV